MTPVGEGGVVAKRTPEGTAYYAGLATCGRVWSCPVCAAKIRHGRAEEVGRALEAAVQLGYTVMFLTLTCRHDSGQALGELLEAQEKAWRSMLQSRRWRDLSARWGIAGYMQVREITWGERSGWHPHRHYAMVLDEAVHELDRVEMESDLWQLWQHHLGLKGLSSERAFGADLRWCSGARGLAAYLAKVDGEQGRWTTSGDQAALELARGDLKDGRHGNVNPSSFLRLLVEDGRKLWAALWREYEAVTEGRRMMSWSVGLRELLGLVDEEVTDEELAAEEVGGEEVVELVGDEWAAVRAASPGGVELLEAVEANEHVGYLAGIRRLLRMTG